MNMIIWIAIYGVLGYKFGILAGLLMGFILQLGVSIYLSYQELKEKEKVSTIRAENMLITLEAAECQGQLVYLAYNIINNKFLLQGLNVDEFAAELTKKFEGKNIFVTQGANAMVPLSAAIQKFKE